MNSLDSFFDTFEKRINELLLLFLISTLVLASLYFYLGVQLFQVMNYQELTSLLDIPWLNHLFMGRLAISLLSMPVLNLFQLFLNVFRFWIVELLFLICCCLFGFTKGNSVAERKGKRIAKTHVLGYLVLCLILTIGFAFGFQAGNVKEVIMIIKSLGILCCLISFALMGISLFTIAKVIAFDLPKALETTTEII